METPVTAYMRSENSSWSEEIETMLRQWRADCFVNAFLHLASHRYYLKVNGWLTYPAIALSTIQSVIVVGASSHSYIKWVAASLSLTSALMVGVTRSLKPAEKAQTYLTTAERHLNIIKNIQTTLSLPRQRRPDASVFLGQIKLELDSLQHVELQPTEGAREMFSQRFMRKPDSLLYFQELEDLMQRPTFTPPFSNGATPTEDGGLPVRRMEGP